MSAKEIVSFVFLGIIIFGLMFLGYVAIQQDKKEKQKLNDYRQKLLESLNEISRSIQELNNK